MLRPGHSHDAADRVDAALENSEHLGRVLLVSFLGLAVTAALEGVVTSLSGSVALLGDSLHNAADALTAVPLWVAFSLGRRSANRRYTYGYGRAEDLAGIAIVAAMAASTAAALWESVQHLIHPSAVSHLPAVMAAAAIGVVGNEAVAAYRVRVGKRIGSAALIADGYHARSDGLTSLAVLAGAAAVAVGWRRADPIVGLMVSGAILVVLRTAARDIYHRLMDAVDPALVGQVEEVLAAVPGVASVADVRVRWVGHRLLAEASVEVDGTITVAAGHDLLETAHHALLHDVPQLFAAVLHADPAGAGDAHGVTAHHRTPTPGQREGDER
ncbi:MAG TPA: cation diffusion facilitator family transporter [Acidimicrobiales bacterium]|nr:cation diffusion facilitator family transporter [Acidimicrobiales bacterium]